MRALVEFSMGIFGFALFWHAVGWEAALGLFLILYANNMGHSVVRLGR